MRELVNVIERATILARGPTLHITLDPSPTLTSSLDPDGSLEAIERNHILRILEQTGWRIRGPGGAADRLALNPTTLESLMKRLGLRRPGSGG